MDRVLRLKRKFIVACLAASGFLAAGSIISQAAPGMDMPGGIQKAAFSNDGLLYILAKGEASIRIYSAEGRLLRSLPMDPGNRLNLQGAGPRDFSVDAKGDVYCLTSCRELPHQQSCIVRIDKTGGASTVVPLGKPLHALQMSRDRDGNFFVLGFEADVNSSMARKQDLPSSVYLVHKFSPKGEHVQSLMPVMGTAADGLLLNAMGRARSFVVLPDGEVWFFELRVDGRTPPWQNARALYHVDRKGSAERIEPASSSDQFVMGIHEYAGDVALEWADRKAGMAKILTKVDGTRIGTVEGGSIQAIGTDSAVCTRMGGSGAFQLTLHPIAPPLD
jgi:hypothetical protein